MRFHERFKRVGSIVHKFICRIRHRAILTNRFNRRTRRERLIHSFGSQVFRLSIQSIISHNICKVSLNSSDFIFGNRFTCPIIGGLAFTHQRLKIRHEYKLSLPLSKDNESYISMEKSFLRIGRNAYFGHKTFIFL